MTVFRNIDGQYESELVSRIRDGDKQAEEDLFRRYHRAVMIIINQAWKNCPLADDLCQETFHITLRRIKAGALNEPQKLPAYIWGVAQKLVIQNLRKRASKNIEGVEKAEQFPDPTPSQLDTMLQKEKAKLARRVLEELRSERDRQVLYRFYIAEDSKEEICADLGLTAEQFNLVLFRARSQYRKLYEKFAARAYR
jgi:RNA polymerase sigma-70 factor, ECF subfamily